MDVQIRLHPEEVERYRMQGRMVPEPQRVRGIVDSAAMRTCIGERTVGAMLLEPVDNVRLHAASGETESSVYVRAALAAGGWWFGSVVLRAGSGGFFGGSFGFGGLGLS